MATRKEAPEIPDELEGQEAEPMEGEMEAEPPQGTQYTEDRVDTSVEFLQYLTAPDAKNTYSQINKDNVLSYLTEVEVNKVTLDAGTIELLRHYKLFDTQKVMQAEISTLLATARSRKGFAAKLLVSNIIEGKNMSDQLARGKSVWNSPMRRG